MITRRTLLASGSLTIAATSVPRAGIARNPAAGDDVPLSPDMPHPFGGLPVVTLPGDPTLHRLDTGWLFHEGDIPVAEPRGNDATYAMTKAGNAPGAAGMDYDDGEWRAVRIPHDWAIEHPVEPDQNDAWAYRRRGIGWYRRTLRLEDAWQGRYLELQLGGIATMATVWFNGIPVAHSFSGYVQQNIDVTPYAHFGDEPNVIAIRVDAQAMEGWWYEGAGIYRDCWLAVRPAVHIATDGIHADPRPPAPGAGNRWRVPVRVTINNSGADAADAQVTARLLARDGSAAVTGSVDTRVAALTDGIGAVDLTLSDPMLWSVERPNLYTLEVLVSQQGEVDRRRLQLGFRTIRFHAASSFHLKGQPLKIKGVCIHQDHAGVGVAVPAALIEWRLRRLKDIGCNAVRSTHYPSSDVLLDVCDRIGLLVMDENRHFNPSTDYLAQLRWLVRRDRNRPCVIMWSVLNEEPMQGAPQGYEMVRRLAAAIKELDDSRPVTAAMNDGFFTPLNGADAVDLVGFNYKAQWYDRYHARHPDRPMTSTEDTSGVMTRGEWRNDAERNVLTSYDTEAPEWGLTHGESWKMIASRPFVAGTFVWTRFDYHGEPTPLPWPAASSSFGILDLCGFAKMAYHLRRAQWIADEPVLAIGPHWNWPGREGAPIRVMVPTNAESVELLLNGRSLERRSVQPFVVPQWQVPYAPRKLEAIAYRGGREIARTAVETTGRPVRLRLTADRALMAGTGRDVQPISVDVLDAAGRHVPTATDRITFTLDGGEVIGVGNGDPNDHDSEQASSRRLFAGLAQVLVRAPAGRGRMTLTARAPGLAPASVVIGYAAAVDGPQIAGTPGAQIIGEWRRTPFAAAAPHAATIYPPTEWRALSHVRPGRLEEAPAGPARTLIQGRLRPRRLLALRGGELCFAGIVGRAELWIDGQRVARKSNVADAPLRASLTPGDRERVVTLLLEADAGQSAGLSRSVAVWPKAD